MSWGYFEDSGDNGIDASGHSDIQADYSLQQASAFAQAGSTISQDHIDDMYARIDNTVRLMIAQGHDDDAIHQAISNMAHPELRGVAAERVAGHLEAASYSMGGDRNAEQEPDQSLFAAAATVLNPFFAALSPNAMGRINGLNLDTQMTIAEEGARLTERGTRHEAGELMNFIAQQDRGHGINVNAGINRGQGAGMDFA